MTYINIASFFVAACLFISSSASAQESEPVIEASEVVVDVEVQGTQQIAREGAGGEQVINGTSDEFEAVPVEFNERGRNVGAVLGVGLGGTLGYGVGAVLGATVGAVARLVTTEEDVLNGVGEGNISIIVGAIAGTTAGAVAGGKFGAKVGSKFPMKTKENEQSLRIVPTLKFDKNDRTFYGLQASIQF